MPNKLLVDFFTNSKIIPADTAVTIASHFTKAIVVKNDFFLKEGMVSDQYFFMQAGFMRAFATNTQGKEITTDFFSAGQMVFEVSSFFSRNRSHENIQALTDCEGHYIDYLTLNNLFHTIPAFREFGRSVLVKGFSSLKNRMLTMITETAEQRYQQLLHTKPQIFQHASLKHIASYLGVTDTSLSRIRREMAGQ